MDHPAIGAVIAAAQLGMLLALTTSAVSAATEAANTKDLGGGFRDHGVAMPISNHRGTVATQDGAGRDVVLSWMYDHRGGYGLLVADPATGDAKVVDTPYNWRGDGPFASILSSRNRYYTHFGSHLSEFDPTKGEFTFVHETVPQMAMSMTEDDQGRIWSATYPNSAVAMYDPATGEFKDYGSLYDQNWRQYPRYIAADDQGWVYIAIGSTKGQILALNPETGEATPLVAENERKQGAATVVRDENGKVYGQAVGGKDNPWMELYGGRRTDLDAAPELDRKPYIAGTQGLFHRRFPSGRVLNRLDLVNRELVTTPEGGEEQTVAFDYPSEGAHTMTVAAASNGTASGGTAFPMRFFSYDPKTDTFTRHDAHGQWNTVAGTDGPFFVGGYGHGFLLEWDPSKPWVDTVKDNPESNPRFLTEVHPTINRPHDLLAHPDGRWVILAGTPGYGYTGGGLLFWDRENQQQHVLEHTDLLPEQSTMSLVALPDNQILGGTTVAAGTGGEVKAEVAELYLLDLDTREITWHAPLLEGAKNYMDMWLAPNGLVYGVADRTRFFAFNPETREIVHEQDTSETVGPSSAAQGTRVFVPAPDGTVYLLYGDGIVTLDLDTHELKLVADSPVLVGPGDWLDGRIYFTSGSHLYSWQPQG